MPPSATPQRDDTTSAPAISGTARAVLHGEEATRPSDARARLRGRCRRVMLRRVTLGSIAVLVLVGLAPLVWAAPLDGSSPHRESVAFAPATVVPTKPSPTVVRPTPTREPFVAPASMARDPGSSMGGDTIRATMPAAMPTTVPATIVAPATAPRNAAVPPSGLPAAMLPLTMPAPFAAPAPFTAPATSAVPALMMACTPLAPGGPIAAAGFGAQWQAGEALTPNFWGPAGTGGLLEAYADAPNGQRFVQYFDKGRMELPDAASTSVTNGLLATELITGRIQVGAESFQTRASAAIPLAGDPDNTGPTYAAFGTTTASLLAPAQMQMGTGVSARVATDGTVSPTTTDRAAMTLSSFDIATQHNVPQSFAAYRDRVGLAAIGYAKSEPFLATVKVGGVPKQVMLQVFERRVLTYTADNAPEFQVEMGNIGQHYYQWRYCGG